MDKIYFFWTRKYSCDVKVNKNPKELLPISQYLYDTSSQDESYFRNENILFLSTYCEGLVAKLTNCSKFLSAILKIASLKNSFFLSDKSTFIPNFESRNELFQIHLITYFDHCATALH